MTSSLNAISLSLQVGAWCVALGFPFALVLGWILARKQFVGKTLLSAIVFSPLVVPPVVTGALLLDVFGRNRVVGAWLSQIGLPISFSMAGAVLAAFVVGLPFYIASVRTAFESIDPRLEEVAWTQGVSPARVFLKVTLPLALPGIAAGAVLAFARALGEFGATTVLAGNMEGKTRTIALAVYTLLETPGGDDEGRHLIYSSLAISFFALGGYELLSRWHRRRLGGLRE